MLLLVLGLVLMLLLACPFPWSIRGTVGFSSLSIPQHCGRLSATEAAFVIGVMSDTNTPSPVPSSLVRCAGSQLVPAGFSYQLLDVSSVSGSTNSPGTFPGPEVFMTFVGLLLLVVFLLALIAGLLWTR